MRLAFAVAAHLEPEILLVDEVLAVGDVAFQKKCLGRMGEVAREGRTVLFVSHNMAIIQSLCSRVIVLDKGRIIADDSTDVAIAAYLKTLGRANSSDLLGRSDRSGRGAILVKSVDVSGGHAGVIRSGEPLHVVVETTGVLRDSACAIASLQCAGPTSRDPRQRRTGQRR